ncbi:hypothetical protein FRUB_09544 [Fimbriiglobus ruber]|uniref:BBC1/AIM3 cysteine proteinase-fold domain-containing protein n=1 Tax=Fimbriiglobus ruber TaxID=1908690 RepID=A0A225CZM2_9BACT|nr:hypothetical protein FRUB_09544 [Fimbriiglobus ruber]
MPPPPAVVVPPPAPVSPPVAVVPPVTPPAPVVPPVVPPSPPVAPAATQAALPATNAQVLAFAQSHIGQIATDPDGTQCYALAEAALRASGAVLQTSLGTNGPISDHYAWGQLVYQKDLTGGYANVGTLASIEPGDIIQFDQYSESSPDGSWAVAAHHTAIVESVNAATGQITVLQQNWNNNQTTQEGVFNLQSMTGGVVSVYQPITG